MTKIFLGLVWLFVASAAFNAPPALTDEPTREEATQAKIADLKLQIEKIQRKINQQEGERDVLQARLKEAELEISALDRSLKQVESAIAEELPRLAALDQERASLDQQVITQQETMADEMRNLWSLQQGGGLRVLFGDQDPDRLARNLAFYRRVLAQRSAGIDRFTQLLDDVARNADAIRASQERLATQRNQLTAQRTKAEGLQNARRTTLAAIESSLSSDAARVDKLQADAEQLSKLLEELRKSLEELDTPASYRPFTAAREQMPRPVAGKPSNRYGGRRNSANMSWRGWFIPAPEGADVRAIHHGRVVYADWLRGQGLLLIIDHGEGYMSLYGHNRSLQREVGDWVAPGDIIATVGSSGGSERPALYFEVRSEGKPVDPGKWLKR